MNKIISINKLSKKYKNDFDALKNMNLNINENEILALLGPNGAGKSSLLNILSGSIVSHEGNVFYDKENKRLNA